MDRHEQVGRLVAAAAARNIVPTTLELGGKSPVIVNKVSKCTKGFGKDGDALALSAGSLCVPMWHPNIRHGPQKV